MRDRDGADGGVMRTMVRGRTLFWGVTIGVVLGGAFAIRVAPPDGERFEARLRWPYALPSKSEWPHAARVGESARLTPGPAGHQLVVTARSAADARGLARAFTARHEPDAAQLEDVLRGVVKKWDVGLPAGPQPVLTEDADLGAWLLARARWGRLLAAELPVPEAGMVAPIHEPDAVLDAWEELIGIIDARQGAALLPALDRTHRAEQDWFGDAAAWQGYSVSGRAAAWREWQVLRAAELDEQARVVLISTSPFQQRLARATANEHLSDLGARLSEPWRAFASPNARALRPVVRPIFTAWWPPLAMGAGAGALLATVVLLLASARAPRSRRASLLTGAVGGGPTDPGPSLHVVCGVHRQAVTRAALELAAHRLAAGERVLLVDGSARLALHERLGRDARWGLLECLAADMPVLGLVQYAGHPGLYLLPHGNAERSVGWSPLGRKLDEVMPHFGRIVLILDPKSPAGVGDSLRGRAMEGWWASANGRSGRAADDAAARFGIVFSELSLGDMPEATLELLVERVRALRPAGPAPELAPITAPAVARHPVLPKAVLEPIVLDCEWQVLQRLRFLAWTRRVQAENRRAALQPTS